MGNLYLEVFAGCETRKNASNPRLPERGFPLLPRSRRGKIILLTLGILAIACGAGIGAGFSYLYDFPEIERLRNYRPGTITRIYANGGELLAELYEERRKPIPLGRIHATLRQAFLAIEDSRFYDHPGVSYPDILRAFVKNLRAGGFVQGGSTITQQLAKVLFLTPERKLKRKIREALLALEIEQRFTKDEILEFYLNQIYLGNGAYGVQAAAQIYFGKSVAQLTLAESATLAALPKAPTRFNPRTSPEKALGRRNLVLQKMRESGFISAEQEKAAREEPLRIVPRTVNLVPEAAYFVEKTRIGLNRRFGRSLYRSGLQIHTTIDIALQRIAHQALVNGIEKINRRRGFKSPGAKAGRPPRLGDGFQFRAIDVTGNVASGLIGDYEAEMTLPARIDPERLREGDLLLGRVIRVERPLKKLFLEWQPTVQGAVVAFDPKTGALRALAGGTNFRRFPFNRATQARRQPGSAFKPIIMGTALSQGYTPAHILMDTPFVRRIPGTAREWKPRNYTNKFHGPVTMRRALEASLNLATIKLLDQLGPQKAIAFAHRLGIRSNMRPYLSLALGSIEVTPYQFTASYIPFATQGVYARPYEIERVTDGSNRVLEENVPIAHRAIPPEAAYQVRMMLRGAITNGTGEKAKELGAFLAGKTGTTNEYRDAWFIGFSEDLVVGVWVGRDDNKHMGYRASGGAAALPIWIDVMKSRLEGKDSEVWLPDPPPGITLVKVDSRSGRLSAAWCEGKPILEAFVAGTEPSDPCPEKSSLPELLRGG